MSQDTNIEITNNKKSFDRIKFLKLINFRSHSEFNLELSGKPIAIIGDNGAGKTNILDAIHYLSQTKSYFNHIDAQNIQFDENYFMLKGVFNKDHNDSEIQCNIIEGEGKSVQNNKKNTSVSRNI